jgi:hypothetical protein
MINKKTKGYDVAKNLSIESRRKGGMASKGTKIGKNRKKLVGKKANTPDTVIDWRAVDEMAQMMMSVTEIALVLGITTQTLGSYCRKELNTTTLEYIKRGREKGKMSLRRVQFKQAIEKGDRTLLIWLGKNYLGQSDNIQHQIEGDLNLKVEFVGDDSNIIDGELDATDVILHDTKK